MAAKSFLWPLFEESNHNIQHIAFLHIINKPRHVNQTNRWASACVSSRVFCSSYLIQSCFARPAGPALLCHSVWLRRDLLRDVSPYMSSEIVVTNSNSASAASRATWPSCQGTNPGGSHSIHVRTPAYEKFCGELQT